MKKQQRLYVVAERGTEYGASVAAASPAAALARVARGGGHVTPLYPKGEYLVQDVQGCSRYFYVTRL